MGEMMGLAMMASMPLLSTLIGLPLVGGIVALAVGGRDANTDLVRWVSLVTVLLSLLFCIPLYAGFDVNSTAMQFRETFAWIPVYKMNYDLGVDGISMLLIVLTAFTNLLVILYAWRTIKTNVKEYFAAFLILQAMITGVFCALDAILFYFFWEGMLIPMYLAIGIWGGYKRSYASIKFFLYTFFGSALLLVAFLYLGFKTGDFNILHFYPLQLNMTEQVLLFIGFLLAFAIKVPMWPVHTWLPDAHTEAPTGGSVILAALLLKVGAYGFLRFNLPILPDASHLLAPMMIVLSLIAIVYIGFVALSQTDMKRLIAYSSVAHMGFVTLGCFIIYGILTHTSQIKDAFMPLEGAVIQMISHGFSAGAMFLGFGMLYERMHTRLIEDFGGIANVMPVLAAFFLVFCLSNVGLPGTSGFVGEFMVILGTFKASSWIAALAALTLIVSASYTLWMYKRVFQGDAIHENVQALSGNDMDGMEWLVCGLLVATIFGLGIYPQPLLTTLHTTTGHLLSLATQVKV